MRGLFLALLLANALTFAWTQWHAPAGQQTSAPAVSAVPTLRLASEAQMSKEDSTEPPVRVAENPRGEAEVPAVSSAAPPDTVAAAPRARTSEPPAIPVRCVSIGPFHDLPETTQASATLRGAGYEPRTRVAEGDVWAGLWVYLEDLPSREEAQRAMTLLKRRGISDAYIMASADQTNDISLGVFSEPERAQRRAEDIRALGFTPTITDRTRRGTVYWIDIDLKTTDAFINPVDLQSESGRIVRLEVLACPPPAASAAG